MTHATNSIAEFYRDSDVFITGVTGFLGKALLEKLLRACVTIGTIYVLIRKKKGLDPSERLKKLLDNPVFDQLKQASPEHFKKIRIVSGDITEPDLGLSDEDRRAIVENVNVVFHSAARLNALDDFQTAICANVLATKKVTDLCKSIKNLKSFVYISTAYSTTHEYTEEIVYDPNYSPYAVMELVKILPSHIIAKVGKLLIDKHDFNYTYTKGLAEKVVWEEMKGYPAAILRPSLVNSSWKEPFPGWLDSQFSYTGIIKPTMLGLMKYHWINPRAFCDIIPVDIVVNSTIVAAWYNAFNSSDSVKVYNCTSGKINGINYRDFYDLLEKYILEYPTKHALSVPKMKIVESKRVFLFYYFLNHYMPWSTTSFSAVWGGLLGGMGLRQGKRFDVSNFQHLMEAAKKAEDGCKFNMDMGKQSDFDWDEYIRNYILGVRKCILKDDMNSLNKAKIKMKRISWTTNMIFVMIILCIVLVLIWL